MKICFPVEADNGMNSNVYGHFGSAPMFILFNTEDSSLVQLNNQNLGHEHGNCSPIQALNGQIVDAIVVGGIGAGAIAKLNAMGIKVYRAEKQTVSENVKLLSDGLLTELNMTHACNQHDGCGH